jgi:hypothetical protein
MRAGLALAIAATLLAGGAAAEKNSRAQKGSEMRIFAGILIFAALFSGVVLAQPAPATSSTADTKTVEGLTVMGNRLPTEECSSRDKACINAVVAELKRLYPEQLKRFCFQREMRAMRNTSEFGSADPGGTRPTQTGVTFSRGASLEIACTNDSK